MSAESGEMLVGTRIGQYHLKRLISTGGMGSVYEALQEQPRRTVAVKVMKEGIVSKGLLRRFEYESQILARLRHPGIAQIYEADTHGEVPYFVMEYIPNAKSITEYANYRKLSVKERLALFTQACEAVHHGHQKGIIHRDLKPANILVDSQGHVKVIDFGVARATDSDMALTTVQTEVGQLIGTVQYMSPEQCEADPHDLDVRSDVYALGVVLYELVCGVQPYELQNVTVFEALRRIREEPVKKPSTALRTLRGDIETILLKALEKDRNRRYQSAGGLSQDIRHYLNGEPIEAKRDSFGYILRKQLLRYKMIVAAGMVLLVVILAGLAVSLTLWRRAVEEAANARFRLEAARFETNRSFEEYQALIPRFRGAEELASLLPRAVREKHPVDYPMKTFGEVNEWLKKLFPAASDGINGSGVEALTLDMQENLDQWVSDPLHRRNQRVLDWIRDNKNNVNELIETTRKYRFYFGLTNVRGPLFHNRLPSLKETRLATKILAANALVSHEEGNHEAVIESLGAAVRLARFVGDGATLINAMVEIDTREMVYNTYRWIVAGAAERGTIPPSYLMFLRMDPPFPDFEHSIICEIRMMRQTLSEAFIRPSENAPARLDLACLHDITDGWWDEKNPYAEPSEYMLEEADELGFEKAVTIISEYYCRLRAHKNSTFQEIELEGDLLERLLQDHPAIAPLLPRLTNVLKARRKAQMNRDATVIATAIFAFEDRNGKWPENIDAALAAFEPPPFHRNYFGHDFVYRIVDDAPLLYTAGPNGIDGSGLGHRYNPDEEADAAGDDVLFLVSNRGPNEDSPDRR